MLHNTHWGMLCPSETPEGQSTGLVKNLSLMTIISNGYTINNILEALNVQGVEELSAIWPNDIPTLTKIFINGNWIGCHPDPTDLYKILISYKRNNDFPKDIGIVHNILNKEIHINMDAGRVMRPLFIIEDNKLKIRKKHIRRLDVPENSEYKKYLKFVKTDDKID